MESSFCTSLAAFRGSACGDTNPQLSGSIMTLSKIFGSGEDGFRQQNVVSKLIDNRATSSIAHCVMNGEVES